jgi:uncharacterized radical SAM protein YgiQ
VSLVALRKNARSAPRDLRRFLPTTREEMDARGWDALDVLIVNGDAYVDHPAFGGRAHRALPREARVSRRDDRAARLARHDDLARMGAPRLIVGITAGNLDSMLNKLTAQKKVRAEDQYSPAAAPGCAPTARRIVYANLCRQAFPGVPIVLGGIEASLRRIAHYDYWSDQVRRSILLDAKADLLIFGMGERPVWEVARRLGGRARRELRDVRGTALRAAQGQWEDLPRVALRDRRQGVFLPSYERRAPTRRPSPR